MSVEIGGGQLSGGGQWRRGGEESGRKGWNRARGTLAELWQGSSPDWSAARSEQLFEGIMQKLETRRRHRHAWRVALTFAGVTVTLLIGLGLVGFGVTGLH